MHVSCLKSWCLDVWVDRRYSRDKETESKEIIRIIMVKYRSRISNFQAKIRHSDPWNVVERSHDVSQLLLRMSLRAIVQGLVDHLSIDSTLLIPR